MPSNKRGFQLHGESDDDGCDDKHELHTRNELRWARVHGVIIGVTGTLAILTGLLAIIIQILSLILK